MSTTVRKPWVGWFRAKGAVAWRPLIEADAPGTALSLLLDTAHGSGDVVAAHPVDQVVLIVQATTIGHVAQRLAKARALPELAAWLRAGGCFEVWGWCQRGRTWNVKRVAVRSQDLEAVILCAPRRQRRPGKGERQASLPGLE